MQIQILSMCYKRFSKNYRNKFLTSKHETFIVETKKMNQYWKSVEEILEWKTLLCSTLLLIWILRAHYYTLLSQNTHSLAPFLSLSLSRTLSHSSLHWAIATKEREFSAETRFNCVFVACYPSSKFRLPASSNRALFFECAFFGRDSR